MRRKVSKTHIINAFRIDVAELDLLVTDLRQLFDTTNTDKPVETEIALRVEDQEFIFADISELRELAGKLPNTTGKTGAERSALQARKIVAW